jgi:prepilin-type processing-associated H-X9-DG protein
MYVGAADRFNVTGSSVVVNEASADVDFRVESNGNANMLFVDGGNNRVGVGEDTPQVSLHVDGPIRGTFAGDGTDKIGFGAGSSSSWYSYIQGEDDGSANVGLSFHTTTNAGVANIEHARMYPDTGTVFNEAGVDLDFRVESDGNTHMLFVDGGDNRVGIGVAPSQALSVSDGAHITVANSAGAHTDGEYTLAVGANSGSKSIETQGSILCGGSIFLGGAAAGNALNDYEEGNWTPVYDGSTSASGVAYTARSGTYTKIGNIVNVSCNLVLSDKGSVAGVCRISGLPFAGNNAPGFHVAACMFGPLDLDDNQQGTGTQYGTNSFIYLFVTENDTALTQMVEGQVNNNTSFHFQCTYMTNS